MRNKLCASVRCALWLVVLVKLATPPTLAAPTGLGWWLRETRIVQISAPEVRVVENRTVPFVSSPSAPTPSRQNVSPKNTSLSGLGWCALLWLTGVAGLASWILFRWRSVARLVREASPAPESLVRLLDQARKSAGIKQQVELRLTHQPISPAVCGLAHPAILLPAELTARLSESSLKSVLLHELVHLRRCDVWVNCAQALIQVVYWWHPLLWMANARIRHLREEAVDDAVVVALGSESDGYAPTLLEVARLALDRPMSALGLVGILESHNSLKQRIARLVNFTAPRKAGLTVFSLIGIAAFAAAALPMEPATTNRSEIKTVSAWPTNAIYAQDVEFSIGGKMPVPLNPSVDLEVKLIKIADFDPGKEPEQSPLRLLPQQAWVLQETNSESNATVRIMRRVLAERHINAESLRIDNVEGAGTNVILASEQAQSLIDSLEKRPRTHVYTSHRKLSSWFSIGVNWERPNMVIDVLTNSQTSTGSAQANYVTYPIDLGSRLLVFAQNQSNAVKLSAGIDVTSFVGYDAKPDMIVKGANGSKLTVESPQPHLRIDRQESTGAVVPMGQTLMITGPVIYESSEPAAGIASLEKNNSRQPAPRIKVNTVFFFTPTSETSETR